MCTHHSKGKHLTQDDRIRIEAYSDDHKDYKEIATLLHVIPSTIWRELKKVKPGKEYCAKYAQSLTGKRRKESRCAYRKISNNTTLAEQIEKDLRGAHEKGDYSPEVIANTSCKGMTSTPAIYRWIKSERTDLISFLPKQGKKYRKRTESTEYGTIKATNPRLISERPEDTAERNTIGHLEGDTIQGQKK